MWVDTLDLDLGPWLVGVRADSAATRTRLQRLLARYVVEPGGRARTNYGVRAPSGRIRRTPAELYVGGERIPVGDSLEQVVHHLVGHLAGIASDGVPVAGVTRVGVRVAVRGERAVLVHTGACTPIVDPGGASGELPVWMAAVDSARRAVIPPTPLAGLDWAGAGLEPPSERPRRVEVVGAVAVPDHTGGPALGALWLAGSGSLDAWGVLLAELEQEQRVVAVPSEGAALVEVVERLLD